MPAIGAPASERFACVPTTDRDQDRLPDAFETGTGNLVDVHATGTDPDNHDSDDDGLGDGDEVLGTRARLDLYRVGARPAKKDFLVEFDWFDDSNDCGVHSHRPSAELVDRMKSDLAAVPVSNPDGSTGINLIADIGQGRGLTGGNLVPDADGNLDNGISGLDFSDIRAANFRPERQGYYHYALQVHRLFPGRPETGQAWVGGMDSVDGLWICGLPVVSQSSMIIHELGHNMGLDHGGADGFINFKPNYNSVMNYRYLFSGTDTNCDGAGDGGPVFSNGSLAPLDENALLEPVGICNGVPIDWNLDGRIQPEPLKLDLTPESFGLPPDGRYDILTDYDDVSNLCLDCIEFFQPSTTITQQRRKTPARIVTDAPPIPAALVGALLRAGPTLAFVHRRDARYGDAPAPPR